MMEAPMIQIWPFYMAPKEWQELSQNGGDEDIIMFVPNGFDYADNFPHSHGYQTDIVTAITLAIGISGIPDEYEVPGGRVYIGAHS